MWKNVVSPIFADLKSGIADLGKAFHTAFDDLAGYVGGAFDAVLAAIKAPINGIIDVINDLINEIDKIHISIPHVPGTSIGGTVGFDIADIPLLADGGIVLPQPGGTLVRAGEAGRAEAVIPLTPGLQALGQGGGITTGDINITVQGSMDDQSPAKIQAAIEKAFAHVARRSQQKG